MTTPNPAPVTTSDAERDLAKIYDAFSIGSKARIIHILMENLSNVLRRERCLAAIERTFFMVPTEPEEEDEGVPGEECLLNWGQDPDEYVRTFRAALKTIAPTESKTVFLVATGETHDGQETYTRHDVRPFLCDAEALYTAPSPALPIDFKQATDQGGWQLVPKEPTEEMLNAGKRMLHNGNGRAARNKCGRILAAMLEAAPTLQGVADGDAESVEPEFCPRCDGEGIENVMSDGGPDAYAVEVECSHCRGNQTLRAAYNGVLDALRREENKYRECAAILYLGRANPTAAKRIAEIAEYLKKPGAQLDWAHDRLMALADMAKTSGDAVGGKSGGAA